jgi:ABC-type multidrug transport system fused ATPase/permease subunit
VIAFTNDQLFILLLVFLLGLIVGLALMSGGKWKRRYREEARRREALEADNKRLQGESQEMDSLRSAAARSEADRRDADRREADRRQADRREADRREGDRREGDRRDADGTDPV